MKPSSVASFPLQGIHINWKIMYAIQIARIESTEKYSNENVEKRNNVRDEMSSKWNLLTTIWLSMRLVLMKNVLHPLFIQSCN